MLLLLLDFFCVFMLRMGLFFFSGRNARVELFLFSRFARINFLFFKCFWCIVLFVLVILIVDVFDVFVILVLRIVVWGWYVFMFVVISVSFCVCSFTLSFAYNSGCGFVSMRGCVWFIDLFDVVLCVFWYSL